MDYRFIEDDWVSGLSFVLHRVILPSWSKNLLTRFQGSADDEEKNVYCYVASFINIRMFVDLLGNLEKEKFKIGIFKRTVFYCMKSLAIKYFHNFVIILYSFFYSIYFYNITINLNIKIVNLDRNDFFFPILVQYIKESRSFSIYFIPYWLNYYYIIIYTNNRNS